MANTSSKLLIRKLVGRSFRSPLLGTLLSLLHSGHVTISWRPLVRRIPFKQLRQKLCKHGSCFGSANGVMHTEQDTSSWRLFSKVLISMIEGGKGKVRRRLTMKSCDQASNNINQSQNIVSRRVWHVGFLRIVTLFKSCFVSQNDWTVERSSHWICYTDQSHSAIRSVFHLTWLCA